MNSPIIHCPLSDIQRGTQAVLQGALTPEQFFEALVALSPRPDQTEPTLVLAQPLLSAANPATPSFARYRNPRELARGGMGVIFTAEDPELERAVAIKVLSGEPQADEYSLRKFLQEARVTGTLEHPNIVPVHELGTTDEHRPYFAMKLVKGESLHAVLQNQPPGYSRSRRLRDFTKICDAVAFAHSRGILHRDLKPQNIMLGEFGEVLVMDWGLAKTEGDEDLRPSSAAPSSDASRTTDGMVIGTPAYMPPEQARAEVGRIDRRSDIYSLGAILYEILVGEPPYRGVSPLHIVAQVTEGKLVPPSERAEVPRELEAVVLKAMAQNPNDRYARVEDLKAEIDAYLEGRLLAAATYNPLQRAVKWTRRHRAVTGAAAAIAILGGLLFGFFRWQAARETERRQEAILAEIGGLLRSLEDSRKGFAEVENLPFTETNGEVKEEVLDRWTEVHAAVLGLLEELVAKARLLPGVKLDVEGWNAERRSRCRTAWTRATNAGLYTLARTWVGRARAAGLEATEEREAYGWIDERNRSRTEESLALARERLAATEKKALAWKPDEWIDSCVYELLRHKSPALVRLLLDPTYLDHRIEAVRLLAIQALGRIADVSTKGPEGVDAVEALSYRLRDINDTLDPLIAAALAEALGHLGDSRPYEILSGRIARESDTSEYRRLVLAKLREVPLPTLSEEAPRTAEEFLARGILYAAHQDWENAEKTLDRAVALAPESAEGYRQRAKVFQGRRDVEGALAQYGLALEKDSRHTGARTDRARLLFDQGRVPEALADVELLLTLESGSLPGYLLRGEILYARGELASAAESFRKVLELDPRSSDAHLGLGRIARVAKDLDLAIRELDLAVALNPEYGSGAYLHRGLARSEKGDRNGALRDFSECIRINGNHVSAFYNRATLYEQMSEIDRALSDYDLCHRVQEYFWPAWYSRGVLLRRLSRRGEAIVAFEGALKHAPEEHRRGIERILEELRQP